VASLWDKFIHMGSEHQVKLQCTNYKQRLFFLTGSAWLIFKNLRHLRAACLCPIIVYLKKTKKIIDTLLRKV